MNTNNEYENLLEDFIESEDKMIEIAYQIGTSKKYTSIYTRFKNLPSKNEMFFA